MRVAIHQPNYAPWCGYFAKMNHCDVFVFLDDVQMPLGRSYVYRTQIRNGDKPMWLSVPTHSDSGDAIRKVGLAKEHWAERHMNTFRRLYGRAPCFKEVFSLLQPYYETPGEFLSQFNQRLILAVARYLGLDCQFFVSSELAPEGQGDDRLISIVKKLGASTYVSGKGGQNYQDPLKFAAEGIELEVLVYRPIPYGQERVPFLPGMSIFDALFHLGRQTIGLLEYR